MTFSRFSARQERIEVVRSWFVEQGASVDNPFSMEDNFLDEFEFDEGTDRLIEGLGNTTTDKKILEFLHSKKGVVKDLLQKEIRNILKSFVEWHVECVEEEVSIDVDQLEVDQLVDRLFPDDVP